MKEFEPRVREAYEKPRLGVIELKTEEVLGTGCKISTSASGSTPCYAIPCNLPGS